MVAVYSKRKYALDAWKVKEGKMMESFKCFWEKLCTSTDTVTGHEYTSHKVGIVKVIFTIIILTLIQIAVSVLVGCSTVGRIVDTSEKIIQGEVYYQTRKGRAKIEEATIDAENRLERKSKKVDKKLKELEHQLREQLKEKKKKRYRPPQERPEYHCRKQVTLTGVKKKCK